MLNVTWEIPDNFFEIDYLSKIFESIGNRLDNYRAIVTQNTTELPFTGTDVIVFVTQDKENSIPAYCDFVAAVFKMGIPISQVPGDVPTNLFPLPYGYRTGFPTLEMLHVLDRPNDVYFCGHNLGERQYMMDAANELKTGNPDLIVDVSFAAEPFKTPAEFAADMMNSKIALCPRGDSLETNRFCEAAKSGCIIICEELPAHNMYLSAPVIMIPNRSLWNSLGQEINKLIETEDMLAEVQANTIGWYKNTLAENAYADFVCSRLLSEESV